MKKSTLFYLLFILLTGITTNIIFYKTTYATNYYIHTCYETNTYCPVEYNIKANVNYSITNDASYLEYINYNNSDSDAIFNYLVIDKNNSIVEEQINNSNTIILYTDNTVIFSSTVDAKISLPCYLVDKISISEEGPCNVLRLKKGDTYEFTTQISVPYGYKVITNANKSNNIKFDTLTYRGNSYDLGYIEYSDDLKLDNYKTLRITFTDGLEDLQIFIPKSKASLISYNKLDTPTFYKFKGNLGDNFEYSTPETILANSILVTSSNEKNNQKFSYVTYKDNDQYDFIKGMGKPTYRQSLSIEGRLNFTVEEGAEAITFAIPYEHKDYVKNINTPTFYTVEANVGDTFEIINSVTLRYSFKALTNANDYNDLRGTFLYYNKDFGTLSKYNPNTSFPYQVELDTYSFGKLRFRVNSGTESLKLYIPYAYKDYIRKYTKPLTENIKLYPGEIIELNNTSSLGSIFMNATMPYKGEFQIGNIIYKNNKFKYYDMEYYDNIDYPTYYITVAPMEKTKIFILNYNDPIDIEIPYEYKNYYKITNDKVINKYEFKAGEIYEYTNKSISKCQLNLTGLSYGRYRYRLYDKNGTLMYTTDNRPQTLTLEPGQTVVLDYLQNVDSLDITISKDFEATTINYSKEDLNLDNTIDILDLTLISNKYNITTEDEAYLTRFDINNDEVVDLFDLTKVSSKM